MLFHFHIKT